MKKKSILSVLLALIMVLSLATPALAATKTSTKTIEYQGYESKYINAPVTVKISNVTSQKTKDYSVYLSDDDVTISGKDSNVMYTNGPTKITLQPNEGEKNTGVLAFYLSFDSKKVDPSTVTSKLKYYEYDMDEWGYDYSEKFDKIPGDAWGYADGSTLELTQAGTYVLYVKPVTVGVDTEDEELNPVFVVVGDGVDDIKATKVTLNKTKATLVKGKTTTLKATVAPKTATDKDVKWTTSNKKVATVTKNGKVKAVSKGKATITVKTANGKKATCTITVK